MKVEVPSLIGNENEKNFSKEDVAIVTLTDEKTNKVLQVRVHDLGGFEVRTTMGKLIIEPDCTNVMKIHIKGLSEEM